MGNKRNQTLKKHALLRDNFKCQKCGLEDNSAKLLEGHHVIPLYMGGQDSVDNLIILCYDCHKFAPDKKEEFDEYMKEEMEGTLTILMKVWSEVRKKHPELFEKNEGGL